MKKLFTILLSISLLSTSFAKKYELGLNLKVGETYNHVYETEATIIQNYGGQEIKILMLVNSSMSFTIKTADNKGYDMDVMYQKMKMTMEMPNGKTSFSSEIEDKNDIMSKLLSGLTNKVFGLKMDKAGKVTEVYGIDELFVNMFKEFPDLSEMQKTQMAEQLKKSYGKKSFKAGMETVTYLFPKKSVAKGEEWVVKTKMESGMNADITTTYVLVGTDGEFYLIEGKGRIETDKNATQAVNGMDMTYDLKGLTKIKLKINKTTGWIVESDITQAMEGKAFIEKNEQIPNGMEIPMIMKMETSISNE